MPGWATREGVRDVKKRWKVRCLSRQQLRPSGQPSFAVESGEWSSGDRQTDDPSVLLRVAETDRPTPRRNDRSTRWQAQVRDAAGTGKNLIGHWQRPKPYPALRHAPLHCICTSTSTSTTVTTSQRPGPALSKATGLCSDDTGAGSLLRPGFGSHCRVLRRRRMGREAASSRPRQVRLAEVE
ncbi:hypothetical protein CH63R_07245 [Colletotrichum higginsianum IMI 349063]|uniref:Uncharacterized protein n=1 Tax=Colletotrichum higginsianum (strain IMI 349063) TaxID=759273 RepID=A0A1B7Y926_COLHI|nr:hypothetical protein CH63R_07245 [Colletotrichum higginsianum IMI 349063]OBR08480.1 hypothetical protein CH63R_07245 [Colletotrichum higginsianum IMI 349063]